MRAVVVLALCASCFPTHDPATIERSGMVCVNCHLDDWIGTKDYSAMDPAIPDHPANETKYPQTCADCHNTKTWFSHPEALFPRTKGPHANIECASCHTNPDDNTGDALGANTQCVSCHPASEPLSGGGTIASGHTDQPQTKFDYGKPNFCLSCHPTGLEKPHNDAAFPQSHHANTCANCHDRTKGSDAAGQNADCRRCHTGDLTRIGDHRADVNTIPSPSGCLECHRGGSRGGD